ncbi:hypothetical protein OG21DRAFT_1607222 [Imleria badia]|nr:hypothetical protein OG21DRAFT_1607222 [Imleria badia]
MANTSPCTPPSKSHPRLPPDTVPVQRFASSSEYRSGDLSLGRKAVLKDVEKYFQVPFANLIHSLFGSLPSNVAQIRQNLVEDGILNFDSDGFQVAPDQSNLSESNTFQPLVDIASKIFSRTPDSKFSFVSTPSTTPQSERRDTARPDCCVVRKDLAADGIHWFDVAVPVEFKKSARLRSQKDNEQKIVWNLHSIMREDPLRRFALGITIENTSLRLWCSSRAFLAASDPVDFLTSIDDVISLFHRIGNADEVQLGWDPTVERFYKDNKVQYAFKIGGQIFRTTSLLASYGADAIISRGTRVWEATDATGNVVVIKDSWRDEDRDAEGLIQAKIFADIRNKLGPEEETKARKYFLQVLLYEDVCVSGEIDKTLGLREEGGSRWIQLPTEPMLSERRHLSSSGHIPDSDPLPTGRTRFHRFPHNRKVHARTVFREVGVPLANLTLLADCLACLSDSQKALYYMHRVGWVHRDFSVTNVLWVEKDGQGVGKLTDLEYAKRVDSTTSHEVRTGTMHFMAVEVEVQHYAFLPKHNTSGEMVPFRMNYLHDIESQWWAAMWMLLYHAADPASPNHDITAQLTCLRQAFPPSNYRQTRLLFFQHPASFQAFRVLSAAYRDACSPIVSLAFHIQECHLKAEKDYPEIRVDENLLVDVHKHASDAYSGSLEKISRSGIALTPLTKKRCSSSLSSEPENKRAKYA